MGEGPEWAVPPAERQAAVVRCRDWIVRVSERDERQVPRGWSTLREDAVRYDVLRGGPGSRRLSDTVNADVPYVDTETDEAWALWFVEAVRDAVWARSLRRFDARLVMRRKIAGVAGVPLRSAALRRVERQSRHRVGCFVAGWEYGAHFRVQPAYSTWPAYPARFAERYEVP